MPKALEGEKTARVTLSLRVTPEIKALIEADARATGRSLAVEAEARLEQSFDAERRLIDQSFGLKLALRAIERTWQFLEERISDEWAEHESGKAAMRQAMLDVIDFGFPAKPRQEMTDAERVELDQLLPQVERVVDAITWRHSDPRQAFPDNHLFRAASAPISFAEAHARGRKLNASKAGQ